MAVREQAIDDPGSESGTCLQAIAAMIAPLSSYWHSFNVIALRMTASCHSSGMDR